MTPRNSVLAFMLSALLLVTIATSAVPIGKFNAYAVASAADVVTAMGLTPSDIVSASLGASDPRGVAIGNVSVGGFPGEGSTFAIMSTGCAEDAIGNNTDGSFTCFLDDLNTSQNNDLVQLNLTLNVPDGQNAISFDWKFYSEEWPEFVGSEFNDAFLAELSFSNFVLNGTEITAPNNVAFDNSTGIPTLITINTSGGLSMKGFDPTEDCEDYLPVDNVSAIANCDDPSAVAGTIYDGATPKLTTIAPIPDGADTVTIIFSIFDMGDSQYDTAVFIDNVKFTTASGGPSTKLASELECNVPSIAPTGSTLNVAAHLEDESNSSDIAGATINWSLEPTALSTLSVTNSSGIAVAAFDLTGVFPGNYTVKANFTGNAAYQAAFCEANVTVTNLSPIADAGPDQEVNEGTAVNLNASGSSDPDNGPLPLSYSWIQLSGTNVTLTGANSANPTFTAPEVGITNETLTFQLTVGDGAANTTDTVSVKVVNVPSPPQTGNLTVIKQIVNDDGGSAKLEDFILKVNNTTVTNGTATSFAVGFYNVSEQSVLTGYSASFSGDCDQFGGINLANGDEKVCIIVNDDVQPSVTVIKHIINDDGGNATLANFELKVNTTTVTNGTAIGLDAGSYLVSELSAVADEYEASFSGDCDTSGNVVLNVGDDKLCIITNNDKPSGGGGEVSFLTVIKHIINDNGGSATLEDFLPLKINDTIVTNGTTNQLVPGGYLVTENSSLAGGYSTGFSGDCDSNGFVVLLDEDNKTCIITNNDVQPTLTIIKHIINDNGGNGTLSDFTLLINGTEVTNGTSTGLNAGFYVVSETSNITGYSTTFSGDCDPLGEIILEIGDAEECIITNNDIEPTPEPALLTVIKTIINDDGGNGTLADFTLKIDGEIVQNGTSTVVESGVAHTVSENVSESQTGKYAQSFSENCPEGVITVQSGQNLVCIITNNDIEPTPEPAHLIVIKHVINDDGGSSEAADFTMTINGVTATGGNSFPGLEAPGVDKIVTPGSYSVTETGPTGYSASFSTDCVGTINAGETKTCTVTNDDIPPPPPANTPGKITAGGAQINKDVNFGFNVQSADGESIKGQLEYQDKAAGINLHSIEMTSLQVSEDGIHGTFSGSATINGQTGYSFTIVVEDNGEPGKNDKFTITIHELGYELGGTLAKGNIQVHK